MEFKIILEPCDEGGFTAYCPDFPGCISEGDTEFEALCNIVDALSLYVIATGKQHIVQIIENLRKDVKDNG